MDDFVLKNSIKELIVGFHKRGLPDLFQRNIQVPIFKKVNKVFVIIGPRRAGKTYVLFEFMKKILDDNNLEDIIYLDFENEKLFGLKSEKLGLILDAYGELFPNKKPILFLDEIQNIVGWERFVRRMNDEGYLVFVSGSNSKFLSKEIATSLRGRDYTIEVLPFSFKEFININNIILENNWEYSDKKVIIKQLFEKYFNLSGFPEVIIENRLEFVDQYFKSMLFQDAIERYNITNSELINLLMVYLSRQYGGDYSINKFNNYAKSNGFNSSTSVVQKYSKILNDIYFAFFITAKQKSLKKQSSYLKKSFMFDHGFINYYNSDLNIGRKLENIVAIELIRRKNVLNFYRNGFECDFITKNQCFQVCYNLNEDNKKREIIGLVEAIKKFKLKDAFILTYDQEEEIMNDNIKIIIKPVWKWLLE